jgi:predicted Zn-dependent peptidase
VTKLSTIAIAGLLASVSGAVASAAALPSLGPNVSVRQLGTGTTAIVQTLSGPPVAAIELWYRAPSTGFSSKPVPSLARLAAQAVAASKPLLGPGLGELVKNSGGRLGVTVYGDSIEIAAVVPKTAALAVVKTMTTVYFAPVLTDAGFKIAQRDVSQEALFEGFNPETAARDAVFGALFASGPQHYPALGAVRDVSAIASADVRAFATRAFRAQNAVLVVSGAISPSILSAAANGRSAESALATAEQHAARELVSAPEPVHKTFDEPSGGYGWIGPPISSEREATALDFVADYLFNPDSGYVTRALGESDPDAFVVGQFITLHDPGVMFVGFSGKQIDAVRAKIDQGLAMLRKPLPAATFAGALLAFQYHLLHDLQTPVEMADNFGWYAVEGNPEYAPGANGGSGRYFQAIGSLTPDFVAAVAEKYLGKPAAVVTLQPVPKKASGSK